MGAGDRNIHETCPAFWAPPLVAAEEVLLDMAGVLVCDVGCSRCVRRESSCAVEEDFCLQFCFCVVRNEETE